MNLNNFQRPSFVSGIPTEEVGHVIYEGQKDAIRTLAKDYYMKYYRSNTQELPQKLRGLMHHFDEEKCLGRNYWFLITINPPPDAEELVTEESTLKWFHRLHSLFKKWKYTREGKWFMNIEYAGSNSRPHLHCVLITTRRRVPSAIHSDLGRHFMLPFMTAMHIDVKTLLRPIDLYRACLYVEKDYTPQTSRGSNWEKWSEIVEFEKTPEYYQNLCQDCQSGEDEVAADDKSNAIQETVSEESISRSESRYSEDDSELSETYGQSSLSDSEEGY